MQPGIRISSWSVVALCPLLALACGSSQANPPPPVPPPAAPSEAGRLAAEPLPPPSVPAAPTTLELTGTARAARTSPLSAKAGGIMRKIMVREGERVEAGQVLCALDPTDIALRTEAAAVGHGQALEALANARSDLDRAEKLHGSKALSDTMLEKARLGLKMAELQLQAAEVGLRMARQALADTRLKAPFAGVIYKVVAEEGQMITTMPPSVILMLVDTDTLEVRVPVPERSLTQVKVGQRVWVVLPAVQVEREARIDRLSEVLDPMTRSIEAIIRLDNKTERLPAGLFAKVRIDLGEDARIASPDAGPGQGS
jgi:RND family efflux transporter MFP subunit